MLKLKSHKKKLQNPLESDESFDEEEIEEGLIKDSVLQLASDRYDDFDPDEFAGSKLRNINAPQADLGAEYKGINVSRKKIASENSSDDDVEASGNENDEGGDDDNENQSNDDSLSEGKESEDSAEEEEEEDGDAFSDEGLSSADEKPSKNKENDEMENGYSVYSKKSLDVHEDIEKGNAIRQQYDIWENLLECRIKLQKCLSATNKLPQNDNFSQLVSKLPRPEQNKISKTVKNLCGTLHTLIDLQMALMTSQPEFSASSKSSNKREHEMTVDEDDAGDADNDDDDASISSSIASGFFEHKGGDVVKNDDNGAAVEIDDENDDIEEPPAKKLRKIEDFSRELNRQHTVYLPARNAAIQKWNDKTRVSSGKVSSANFSAFDQSTLKQIEQILCDKERLIKRTQTKRSVYCALDPNRDQKKSDEGDEKKQVLAEFDEEIFDDDDFYHKLLRDLIDQRSSDITDPSKMGRQWVELQKARSKMKRNIDVKSTKGRRLRYTVHQKLVNFMAPIPYNSYTDEAESELFNSLFGKLKQ